MRPQNLWIIKRERYIKLLLTEQEEKVVIISPWGTSKETVGEEPAETSFLCRIIESHMPKSLEKPPKLKEYDVKRDPDEHVKHVDDLLNYCHADEMVKWKLFALTLIRLAKLWLKVLLDENVDSWIDLCNNFFACVLGWKRRPVIKDALIGIT